MSENDRKKRRYSEEEFALILSKASEIQRSSGGQAEGLGPGGLTLEEIQSIATEAGIDAEAVTRAASILGALEPEEKAGLARLIFGGPSTFHLDCEIPGRLQPEEIGRILEQINVDEFDALVFIGGSGAQVYFDYPAAQQLVQVALEKKKVLGAICLAPVILARAGVLKDLPATCYPTLANELVQAGATYTGNPVERQGNIITAKGPAASKLFGQTLVQALME